MSILHNVAQDLPLGIQMVLFIGLLHPSRTQDSNLGDRSQIVEDKDASDAVIKLLLFYAENLRALINMIN
jgi:hypothetical protein